MEKILNRGLYLLPSVDTEKGTFFVRNYFNEDENITGVIIYNDRGEFIIDKPGMKYKETEDNLIDRMIYFIEKSSLF